MKTHSPSVKKKDTTQAELVGKILAQSRKEAVKETIEKWRQAIYYSEDTKSCLDRKTMMNHFNEAKLKTNTK